MSAPAKYRREDLSWQEDALCREVSPALFFPEPSQSSAEGLKVCRGCEVRAKCLDYAMNMTISPIGLWGGTTETQRKHLRRTQGMAA